MREGAHQTTAGIGRPQIEALEDTNVELVKLLGQSLLFFEIHGHRIKVGFELSIRIGAYQPFEHLVLEAAIVALKPS